MSILFPFSRYTLQRHQEHTENIRIKKYDSPLGYIWSETLYLVNPITVLEAGRRAAIGASERCRDAHSNAEI